MRQARLHIRQIVVEFAAMQLSEVRPSHVNAWVAKLQRDLAVAYVHSDESTRSAIDVVIKERMDSVGSPADEAS